MELTVIRYSSGKESTLGLFLIDGAFETYTLEDEHRDVKEPGETRIPAGRYQVKLRTEGSKHETYKKRYPQMHKGMLHITDVPNFRWILIHCGNTDKDTEGCLLVGDQTNNNQVVDGKILNSRPAYERIYPPIAAVLVRGEEVWVTIKDQIPIDQQQSESIGTGLVTAPTLNIRKSPQGAKAGVLFEGSEAEILSTQSGWHHVKVEGWLAEAYVRRG